MKIKRLSKKVLGIVLALAVLASTLMLQTLSTFADGAVTASWADDVASEFAGGSGTDADPYKIATPQQLALLGKRIIEQTKNSDNVLYTKCSYILTADIALNNVEDQGDTPWYERTDTNLRQWNFGAGAVSNSNYFSGKFDGDGHVIKGIYINTNYVCAGLFIGAFGDTAIKNLGIESSYIESTNTSTNVGAIIGRVNNSAGTHTINNCYVADSVILKGRASVGGFIGELGSPAIVEITNCYSSAQVNSGGNKGAFSSGAGAAKSLIIKRSFSTQEKLNFSTYLFTSQVFEDCYTLGTATTGITALKSIVDMQGENAKTKMPGLNYSHKWTIRDGDVPHLTVFSNPEDTAVPTLENTVAAVGLSKTKAAVTWPTAVEDVTAPEDMVYTVYRSTAPITNVNAAGVENCGICVGENDMTLEGFTIGAEYYFAVVATDEAGKSSTPVSIAAPYKHAYSETDEWDGTVAEGFTVGNGKADRPYMIISAEQLAYLAELCSSGKGEATSGKYYTLNVDVDLKNQEWTVGTSYEKTNTFYGTFNGNGHVIKGLCIDESAKTYNGLFAAVTGEASFKNFGIEASNLKAGDESYVGVIAGASSDTLKSNGVTVENVYIGSDVTLDGPYQGGIFGTVLKTTTIKNSYSLAKLTADEEGKKELGTLIGAYPRNDISVTVDSCYSVSDVPMVNQISQYSKISYSNSYTLGAECEGLATRTLEQMTGENARKYMSALDFTNTWSTTASGTPILTTFVPKPDYSTVKWDGTVATGFAGGDGSASNPYQIANAAQLALFGKYMNENTKDASNNEYRHRNYILTADIILNDLNDGDDGSAWYDRKDITVREWTYGATNGSGGAFCGTFDGNGHTIKGIYINSTNKYVGFISKVSYTPTVKNLGIESSYMKGNASVGAIFGGINNWVSGNITIENCYVAETVTLTGSIVGGFIGNNECIDTTHKTIIRNCASSANIVSNGKKGSLIGNWWNTHLPHKAEITNCYATQTGMNPVGGFYSMGSGYAAQNLASGVYLAEGDIFTNFYTAGNNLFWATYYTSETDHTGKSQDISFKNVTKLTANQLKGAAAAENMIGLDFEGDDAVWRTTPGGYPQLTIFPETSVQISDTEKPVFAEGKLEAIEQTKVSITVGWPKVTDNVTPDAFISYSVYYSENPITEAALGSATLLGSCGYEREATLDRSKVANLGLESKFYFAVVAVDEFGNKAFLTTEEPISPKASENKVWQGVVGRSFESGTGTEDDPYIIANAEQLAYFASKSSSAFTNNKYFKLVNDISLNDVTDENWKKNNPNEWYLGLSTVNSNGVLYNTFFDGDGHIIKGLFIDDQASHAGLFRTVEGNTTIQKLGFIESYVSVTNANDNVYAAAMVGRRNSGGGGKTYVLECFLDETVEIKAEITEGENTAFAGGFFGALQHSESDQVLTLIKDCYSGAIVSGTAKGKYKYYGVFAGDVYSGNRYNTPENPDAATFVFENCFSTTLTDEYSNDYQRFMSLISQIHDRGRYLTYKNCYIARQTNDNITYLPILDMIGKDADKNLKLDYENLWVTTENGTPMLKAFLRDGEDRSYLAINRLPITVSFATDCDLKVESISGCVGEKIELPAITREGYEFLGWYLYAHDSSLEYPIDFFPAYDLTLYAKWKDLSTLRVDFEKYPYVDAGEEGLGEDHVWFKPGVDGYSAKYVHGGGRSMRRIGQLDTEQSFQLFNVDSNKLEVGKKYELTMWVYADDVTSGKIMLESSDRLKISKKSTVIADIANVTALTKGEWQKVKVEFTAQNPYVLIRTSGSNSLYFDDVTIYEKGVGDLINTGTDTGNKTEGSEIGKTGESNAIVICFVVFAVSALMMAVVILLKKKQFRGEK